MPQLNALGDYWAHTPPLDVMVASYFGYGSGEKKPSVPPPLPSPLADPASRPPTLNMDQVSELFRMFPSGKITVN